MKAIDKLIEELGHDGEQVVMLLKEATDSIAYYRRILEHYEFDALTGLPGSVKFHDFIIDIEKHYKSIGIIFFDVNDLKEYNDTLGHQAGNLLLQKAAESILAISDDKTHVFRVGGDEFVAIMLNCTEEDINLLLAKWREKLTCLNRKNDGVYCRIAAGVAFGSSEYNVNDILKLADERMYENKRRLKEQDIKKAIEQEE